jgi:hypothetical protein
MEFYKHKGVWQNICLEDVAGEIWKPAIGYSESDGVLCSNMGRIKVTNKNGKNICRILKLDINKSGYQTAQIERNGHRRTFTVHRMVAKLFIPNPNNLPEVNHILGIKHDNRATELEWVDRNGNMQHAADVLHHFCGLNSGRSKFTEKDVLDIFYSEGAEMDVAKIYGVSHSVIGFIRRKQSYTHLLKDHHREPYIFNSQKRLTKTQVLAIYNSSLPYKETAALYGIKQLSVYHIKSGKRYADITGGKRNTNPNAKKKLCADDIDYISKCGLPTKELMIKFNVSKSLINIIKRTKNGLN